MAGIKSFNFNRSYISVGFAVLGRERVNVRTFADQRFICPCLVHRGHILPLEVFGQRHIASLCIRRFADIYGDLFPAEEFCGVEAAFIMTVFRTHVQRVQQTAFAECCRQFFDAFLLVSRARIVRTCPELRNIHQHGRKRLRRVVGRGLYRFGILYFFRFRRGAGFGPSIEACTVVSVVALFSVISLLFFTFFVFIMLYLIL